MTSAGSTTANNNTPECVYIKVRKCSKCVFVCLHRSPHRCLRIKLWNKRKWRWDFRKWINSTWITCDETWVAAVQTFGSASACDEDDDEDDECQQEEGGEDVAQRQEKVMPLVWQNDVDDSRWLDFSGVWVERRSQHSAFSFPLFFVLSLTNRLVRHQEVYWTDITHPMSNTNDSFHFVFLKKVWFAYA